MYKLLLKNVFILFIVLCFNSIKAQNNFVQRAPFINFNYENILRFEFPINTTAFNRKDYYNEVLRTKDFIPLILGNISEVGYETQTNLPLDIDIVKLKNTSLMHVYRNKRPVTYHMKDSTLLFHGFHKIRLVEAGYSDIFLYFDKEEDLRNLLLIDFDTVKTNVYQLIKTNKISDYKMMNSTDLFFTQVGDLLLYTGQLGYTQKYRPFFNIGIVASSLYDKIGGSIYFGLGLGKYSLNNFGQGFEKYKFGIEMQSVIFDNLIGYKLSLNYLKSNFVNGFSFGSAVGVYGLSEQNNNSQFQNSLFFGHIIEKNNFRFSFDYLFNKNSFTKKQVDIPIFITAGFHF